MSCGNDDISVLQDSIQDMILKNYEIEANRSKVGHTGGTCFWTRQTLADMVRQALPLSRYVGDDMYKSLYNLYLKLGIK